MIILIKGITWQNENLLRITDMVILIRYLNHAICLKNYRDNYQSIISVLYFTWESSALPLGFCSLLTS